jgi:hypothetical protein
VTNPKSDRRGSVKDRRKASRTDRRGDGITRLREDNEDLRQSALLWRRLYEAATTRVNDLKKGERKAEN